MKINLVVKSTNGALEDFKDKKVVSIKYKDNNVYIYFKDGGIILNTENIISLEIVNE